MGKRDSVEAVLGRMRRELVETLERIPDRSMRAELIATVAALYAVKLLESVPGLKVADAAEARELMAEARELMREAVRATRRSEEGAGPRGASLEPSLN